MRGVRAHGADAHPARRSTRPTPDRTGGPRRGARHVTRRPGRPPTATPTDGSEDRLVPSHVPPDTAVIRPHRARPAVTRTRSWYTKASTVNAALSRCATAMVPSPSPAVGPCAAPCAFQRSNRRTPACATTAAKAAMWMGTRWVRRARLTDPTAKTVPPASAWLGHAPPAATCARTPNPTTSPVTTSTHARVPRGTPGAGQQCTRSSWRSIIPTAIPPWAGAGRPTLRCPLGRHYGGSRCPRGRLAKQTAAGRESG